MTDSKTRSEPRTEVGRELLKEAAIHDRYCPDPAMCCFTSIIDSETILAIEAEAAAPDAGLRLDPDRLTAIIESRMSRDLAWLRDDGKTVDRFNAEQVGWAIAHLYETGDVVSGLPARAAHPAPAGPAVDAPDLDVRAPRFREAVRLVFEAPGEDFGPARGYYRGDIDHFIEMLDARLRSLPSEPPRDPRSDTWNATGNRGAAEHAARDPEPER